VVLRVVPEVVVTAPSQGSVAGHKVRFVAGLAPSHRSSNKCAPVPSSVQTTERSSWSSPRPQERVVQSTVLSFQVGNTQDVQEGVAGHRTRVVLGLSPRHALSATNWPWPSSSLQCTLRESIFAGCPQLWLQGSEEPAQALELQAVSVQHHSVCLQVVAPSQL